MARLGHGRAKDIETADIYRLTRFCAQALVKLFRILARELSHAANPQQTEIAKHGRPNRNKILKTPVT
jgi:hypothetical protein